MLIVSTRQEAPDGFRNMTEEEIANDFLAIDTDKNYFITKNEWMIHFIKFYEKDLDRLDAEGPDSIMLKIKELSDEFDKIDIDGNFQIDFLEFKEFYAKNVYISE